MKAPGNHEAAVMILRIAHHFHFSAPWVLFWRLREWLCAIKVPQIDHSIQAELRLLFFSFLSRKVTYDNAIRGAPDDVRDASTVRDARCYCARSRTHAQGRGAVHTKSPVAAATQYGSAISGSAAAIKV